jgi:hypothetical protein
MVQDLGMEGSVDTPMPQSRQLPESALGRTLPVGRFLALIVELSVESRGNACDQGVVSPAASARSFVT